MPKEADKMKKVSIIVPVYNAQNSIGRCIESILNQDYENIELIAVNDGRKDNSGKILDEYAAKDSRMIVIHKTNSGVSDTRNIAIARASGTYLQFLDADDYIPVDSTKSMVRALEENNVDLVVSDFYRVVKDNLSLKGSIVNDKILTRNEYASLMAESPADYYYGVLWNKLYKASIIKDNAMVMDKDLSFCEDFIFNLEYLMHCSSIYPLQVPVYYYVKTEGSLVSKNISLSKLYNAKTNVFKYYDSFFKEILSEKEYARDRLLITKYLISVASDDIVNPLSINTHKVGDEYISVYQKKESSIDSVSTAYYFSKIYERYLNTIAIKYDLELRDIKILDMISRYKDVSVDKELSSYTGISMPLVLLSLEKMAARNIIDMRFADFDVHAVVDHDSSEIIKDLKMVKSDIFEICTRDMNQKEKEEASLLLHKMTENIKDFLK